MNVASKRALVIAGASLAGGLASGWLVGMLDFLAPSLVRWPKDGRCTLFCVESTWVIGGAIVGAVVTAVLAARWTTPDDLR